MRKMISNLKRCFATKPAIASLKPIKIDGLDPSKVYKWCTCGLSLKQPWCDGSHKTTSFKSLKFNPTLTSHVFCVCKYSNSKPFCDGTHKSVKDTVLKIQKDCKCQNTINLLDGKRSFCPDCGNCEPIKV